MTGTIDTATARRVLDLPLPDNDAEAATVRDYLIKLLGKVWDEGECFDGKRPFGNSGWDYDLHQPLVTNGLVEGRMDTDGYVEEIDREAAYHLIAAAIRELR
ncbi:hypothetical protein [Micromonospora wenchangensis]|uniref:hypothetical protein n=1 Tax=Micromonospora wenchangensis TaxID=1185415 RepID=UPI0038307313